MFLLVRLSTPNTRTYVRTYVPPTMYSHMQYYTQVYFNTNDCSCRWLGLRVEQSSLTNADGVKETPTPAQRLLQERHVYEEGIVCRRRFLQKTETIVLNVFDVTAYECSTISCFHHGTMCVDTSTETCRLLLC